MMAAQERAEARNKALEHMFGSLFVPGSDIWDVAQKLEDAMIFVKESEFVGSRTIPGAWTDKSDLDVICLVDQSEAAQVIWDLEENGFKRPNGDMEKEYQTVKSDFLSLKYVGKSLTINILLTSWDDFYTTFIAANKVCVALRLKNRDDRVAVFQTLLYSNLEHKFAEENPLGCEKVEQFVSAIEERQYINNPEANLF